MKKIIFAMLALLLCLSFAACANYDREQYRADALELSAIIVSESENLNQVHHHMNGYWMAVQNEDGKVDDVASMVVDALENTLTNSDSWDIVDAMSKVYDSYNKVSATEVSGRDKEIKSLSKEIYSEYCTLNELIVIPSGTRNIWENNVFQCLDEINRLAKEIAELANP